MSIQKNRELLAFTFGIDRTNLLFPDQCHTSNVLCVQTKNAKVTETDALITNIKGIAVGVLAADCVPILFFDKKNNVVAAAHAGWRGTVQKITVNVLQKMKMVYNTSPEDILVGIGPCIQQKNYEVGSEVLLQIEKHGSRTFSSFIQESANIGHAYVDLPGINKQMLLNEGVPEANIEVMKICTYSNSGMFFSARRDGFQTGRFGSVIMLK